jgi:hypothetical protein
LKGGRKWPIAARGGHFWRMISAAGLNHLEMGLFKTSFEIYICHMFYKAFVPQSFHWPYACHVLQ